MKLNISSPRISPAIAYTAGRASNKVSSHPLALDLCRHLAESESVSFTKKLAAGRSEQLSDLAALQVGDRNCTICRAWSASPSSSKLLGLVIMLFSTWYIFRRSGFMVASGIVKLKKTRSGSNRNMTWAKSRANAIKNRRTVEGLLDTAHAKAK